ncbi:TOM1-like protein 2 [Schistosoma japonicum]|nr:TOM1-like protein 2 [Schistosoma japonicum]
MQNIFQPHPFSTAIGTLTERATDSGQPSEDWALILEICDTVNETDDGPKEAIRAIKKRLVTSAGKDNVSIWYTLTLLETLVKNCGKRFHSHVANKEFLHAFLKLLSPKNDPPQHLQTKVLYMLKCWISSNWDVVGKRDLEKVYASLLQKGVQFPTVAPVDCYVAKPSRCLSPGDNMVIPKTSVTRPRIESHEHDKFIARPVVAKSSEAESDVCLRNHLAANSSSSNILHPCSVCHCIHELNIQPLACHNLHSKPSTHSYYSSASTYNRHARNVHFDRTMESRPSQNSVAPNDCTVMVVNSDNQPSSSLHHCPPQNQHQLQTYCLPSSNITSQPISTNHVSSTNTNDDEMEFDEEGTVRRLNASQRMKLTEDLTVVETNINVLNDLLAELRPDTVSADDLNLLKELNCTCRAMHQRVMEFLSQVSDEEVTPSLIQVNDNLTNALSRYDRFERYYQRAVQSADNIPTSNQQLNRDNPRQQLFLTAPPVCYADLRYHHSNPQQQLAITAGPSSLRRKAQNPSTSNGVFRRVDGVQHNLEELSNRSITTVTSTNHANNNKDDDDESLLDVSEGRSESTTRSLMILMKLMK